jgi:regulator of protease activity HflC (stomatin/prohibitin superfamily)
LTIIDCVSWFAILASIAANALIIAWGLASRASWRRKWFLGAGLLLAFFALTTTVLSAGLFFIEPDERGVVISAVEGGVRPEPLQPGLNWVVPYLEAVITYPITRQSYVMTVIPKVGSQVVDDMVQVKTAEGDKRYVGTSALYAIDPDRVVEVHIRLQDRYEEDLIRPVLRWTIRDTFNQYGNAMIDSDNIKPLRDQIQSGAALALQEGGILLFEFTLTEVLTEQEHSAFLEQRRGEEPEEEEVTVERESSLAGVQSALQTVTCLAFPLMVIVALVLSLRRKAVVSETPMVAVKGEAVDAAQVVGMDTFQASSPEDYYLLGKALLERGERAQAIEAFTIAYRTSEDPILKRKALKQLEGLDAVKRL